MLGKIRKQQGKERRETGGLGGEWNEVGGELIQKEWFLDLVPVF